MSLIVGGIMLLTVPWQARGQELSAVVVDDSPSAAQMLRQAIDLSATNAPESARLCGRLLAEFGDRLIATEADDDLFVRASRRAAEFLVANRTVRDLLRQQQESESKRRLTRGDLLWTAECAPLTAAGLDAALALGEQQLSDAHFEPARAWLASVEGHPDLHGRRAIDRARLMGIAMWGLGDDSAVGALAAELSAAEGGLESSQLLSRLRASTPPKEPSLIDPLSPGEFGVGLPSDLHIVWRESMAGSLTTRLLAGVDQLGFMRGALEDAPNTGALLTMLPTATPDAVLVEDGNSLMAFEREAPRQQWQSRLTIPTNLRLEGGVGDLNAVVVWGESAFAIDGHAGATERLGSGSLICADKKTGRILWETQPPSTVERRGGDFFFHGAPVIADGVVAVQARKVSSRLETTSALFGFATDDGRHLWTTQLGSCAGTRMATLRPFSSPLRVGGDVIVSTASGTLARVALGSGVISWIRRGLVPVQEPRYPAFPWEMSRPILLAGRVFSMGADGVTIEEVNPDTGALVERLPIGPGEPSGSARYLLVSPACQTVLAVGSDIVAFNPASLRDPLWSLSTLLAGKGPDPQDRAWLRGRVQTGTLADGTGALVIPLDDSVELRVARTGVLLGRLEQAGPKNPLLSNGSLFLSQGDGLLAAMSPEGAAKLLAARVDNNERDAAASVALARFAIATDRSSLVIERLDKLTQAVVNHGSEMDRLQLMEAALTLARGSQAARDRERLVAAARILAPDTASRAQVTIAQGELELLSGDQEAAAQAWIEVISSAEMSSVLGRWGEVLRRADIEARARLRAIGRGAQAGVDELSVPAAARKSRRLPRVWGEPGSPIEIDGRLPTYTERADATRPMDVFLVADGRSMTLLDAADLSERWRVSATDRQPTILRTDEEMVLMWQDTAQERPSVTRIDPASGEVAWSRATVADCFPAEKTDLFTKGDLPYFGEPLRIEPFVGDDDLALVRGDGHAALLRLSDGGKVWATAKLFDQVTAVVSDRDYLVMAGRRNRGESIETCFAVIARADGRISGPTCTLDGQDIKWLLLERNRLFLGTALGIECYDASAEPALMWRNESASARQTDYALLEGTSLVVLGLNQSVKSFSETTGDYQDELFQSDPPNVFPGRPSRSIASGAAGVLVFDHERLREFSPAGALIGQDSVSEDHVYRAAVELDGSVLLAAVAPSGQVLAEARGRAAVRLWRFDTPSGMKLAHDSVDVSLPLPMESISAVDGWVLLGLSGKVSAIPFVHK